jgi:haloalkane dehalogenase
MKHAAGLTLWGADDAFVPVSSAQRPAGELPDTELVVVEGVGHFLYDDASERTTAAVMDLAVRRART